MPVTAIPDMFPLFHTAPLPLPRFTSQAHSGSPHRIIPSPRRADCHGAPSPGPCKLSELDEPKPRDRRSPSHSLQSIARVMHQSCMKIQFTNNFGILYHQIQSCKLCNQFSTQSPGITSQCTYTQRKITRIYKSCSAPQCQKCQRTHFPVAPQVWTLQNWMVTAHALSYSRMNRFFLLCFLV